ncbi:hypothetical protein UFOVP537_7 [uncultured Caudovirales phage]|uniref:Uncharacterized protein n=1 Tax=uncultured Caudovirales phage TaxID=2100421 RepID=A0A6J5MUA2_9CAUD|nr:hypothetical protein UFOVP537_7 [uncultured Caudovirales phage]
MPAEVKGLIELQKALKNYAPNLAVQLDDQMALALGGVVKKAQSYVPNDSPLSNWSYRKRSEKNAEGLRKFPLFNAARVVKNIKYSSTPRKTNRRGFKAVYFIINKSAEGAIYETAGRKNPSGQPWVGRKGDPRNHDISHSNNPNAGADFIQAMGELKQGNIESSTKRGRYMKGRLIFRAWAEDGGKANAAALTAIYNANEQFKKKQYFKKVTQ